MEKIFDLRVEKKQNKLSVEAYRNGQEEPFAKHQVEIKTGAYLDAHVALNDTLRAFEREVASWLMKTLSPVG